MIDKILRISLRSRAIAVVVGTIGSFIALFASPAAAGTVWIGEFEDCQRYYSCRNLSSGDVLNIDLYEGWLNGVDPGSRCADYGGQLGFNRWYGWVCLSADF